MSVWMGMSRAGGVSRRRHPCPATGRGTGSLRALRLSRGPVMIIRHSVCIPATVLLLVLVPPSGRPEASAGTYTWTGVVGAGIYEGPPFYQEIDFTSHGGTLTINYDPDDLADST